MNTTRRNWLKSMGLLSIGLTISPVNAIATPILTPLPPFSPTGNGPIRLCFNENPYGPSPNAIKAIIDTASKSNQYPWQMIDDFRDALAKKNGVAPESTLIGAGSSQIIDAIIRLAAIQKGNFVLADPTFDRWASVAEAAGLQKNAVGLTPTKSIDLDKMLQAINADTRLVYVCNPNNPTGTICNNDALVAFVKKVPKDTLVLVDEAYLDYTDEPSLARMANETSNLVVVKTFSKIYGLAGARIGYAIAQPGTIEKLYALHFGAQMGISTASLAAALASINDKGFVQESSRKNQKVRAYTIAELKKLDIPSIPSHTNFIYFSLENYKKDFFLLLKKNDILGTGIFQETGKWSRITVGTIEEMHKFIQVIS